MGRKAEGCGPSKGATHEALESPAGQKLAPFLDAVHRPGGRGRGGGDAAGPQRQGPGHGRHAALFSGAALCRNRLSGLYLLRLGAAPGQRSHQSDGGGTTATEKARRGDSGRAFRHHADAVDLHPVLYVPTEFYVNCILPLWRCPSGHGLCSLGVCQAGSLPCGPKRLQKRGHRPPAAGGVLFPDGLCAENGL